MSPAQVEVVADQGDDRLTLTSCNPKYSARQRIVVAAALVEEPAPTPPTTPPTTVDSGPAPEPAPAAPAAPTAIDAEPRGPVGPAIWLGLLALAVWLLFYALSRRWRRWPAYLLGAPVFGLALFVFFQAVANTLPANF